MANRTSREPAMAAKRAMAKAAKLRKTARKSQARQGAKPARLVGGNPQIPKVGDNASVQAYIAAMPGWKTTSDATSTRASCAPSRACARQSNGIHRLTGVGGQGWLLGAHCFTNTSNWLSSEARRGVLCRPGESRRKGLRYLDIHEDDQLDEAQSAAWVKQASQLPGSGKA